MASDLLDTVFNFPLIDNHCHNLLTPDAALTCPLEVCFSEARGEALNNATETSALKRGIQQLAKLYNCEPSLEDIKRARDTKPYYELCKTCIDPTGIQALLLDDGLDPLGSLMDVQSHVGLVDVARRILRIESVAEKILNGLIESIASTEQSMLNFAAFEEPLKKEFEAYARSESAVAFKSIAAYRSGLSIEVTPNNEKVAIALGSIVREFSSSTDKRRNLRLTNKILIDYILNMAINIAVTHGIPIQFHTGFGDSDLDLISANPLLLRPLIESHPNAKIVLLHSAYPYTRQAAYLASVYANIYVDTGLVFPLISASGQQANLRELLEICPSNKILFSTDGHYHAESFYLAATQSREILGKVLSESVENGDFTKDDAVKIAKQIMFENSNKLYKLNLIPKLVSNVDYPASNASFEHKISILKNKGVKFVRIGYMECSNQYRFHIVPMDRFQKYTIHNGVTIMRALTALPYHYDMVPSSTGFNATGEIIMKPDISTLVQLPYYPKHANVQTFFEDKLTPADDQYKSTDQLKEPIYFPLCPRTCLKNVADAAQKELGITFLCGTEFEFVLLKNADAIPPIPIDNTVYAAAASFHGREAVEILDRMVECLQEQGIEVEQFHSESAPGQFEIVTGPQSPLIAADRIVITRQTIYEVAAQFGVKATFVPKPFKNQAGTGAHLHVSFKEIEKPIKDDDGHPSGLSTYERSFIAGVLHHIKSICAFALPTNLSYSRTVDNCWAGSWVCWGVENRETPIRVCYRPKDGPNGRYLDVNFEHKFVDATSNPYLIIAAIISGGVDGIKKGMVLPPVILDNPASLSDADRKAKGITERMPGSLTETLDALKTNEVFINALGKSMVECYVAVKEEENILCSSMSYDEQLKLLISRL